MAERTMSLMAATRACWSCRSGSLEWPTMSQETNVKESGIRTQNEHTFAALNADTTITGKTHQDVQKTEKDGFVFPVICS